MINVIIESLSEDKDTLELFRDHLCYAISDESGLILECKGWSGHSGGDDAYFGLMDKKVKVIIK